jgi:hypothetical protein
MQETDGIGRVSDIESVRNSRGNAKVKARGSYFSLPYYKEGFPDAASFGKFVKAVESLVRKSDDYKAYIGYLHNIVGLNHCSFLGNVSDQDADLEFHHYPFTLWDCTSAVAAHMAAEEMNVSVCSVAEEVLKAHFRNEVGGVMLSQTAHQMAHAGQVFVSLSQVFGDVNAFVERYRKGITGEMADGLNNLVEMSGRLAPHGGCFRVRIENWNLMGSDPLKDEDIL